jgi:hypothetical protein
LSIGLAGLNSNYNVFLQKRPANHNQFEFNGKQNYVYSSNFSFSWQNFVVFGEGAQSQSGGIGTIGGFVASLSNTIDLALSLRHYDRDFHTFYGNAISENSRVMNENGTYWGIQVKPNNYHKLNAYFDKFSFPWLKYRTEAPSGGYEYLIRYTYSPTKYLSAYTQMRQQSKPISISNSNLNYLIEQIKRNYLFNIEYNVTPKLWLKTKIQTSILKESERTKGIAIIQDVNFELWKLKFHTRIALFDTDNFDNAQYVYENDVLYAFSIPSYSGTGTRAYVMVRYDILKDASMWVRYARFTYRDRNEIGSGLEKIDGNTSTQIKMMVRIKF